MEQTRLMIVGCVLSVIQNLCLGGKADGNKKTKRSGKVSWAYV